MNPRTPAARKLRVEQEVRRIRCAWPEARITWSSDREHAVAIIREPESTYIIEVHPGHLTADTTSLHVPDRLVTAREGWVD